MEDRLFCFNTGENNNWDIVISGDGKFSLTNAIDDEVGYIGMFDVNPDENLDIWQAIESLPLDKWADLQGEKCDDESYHLNIKEETEILKKISKDDAKNSVEMGNLLDLLSKYVQKYTDLDINF